MEDQFFRTLDTVAAEALQWMREASGADMPLHLRRGWATFVYSLLNRHPEGVARVKGMASERLEEILGMMQSSPEYGGDPSLPKGKPFHEFADGLRQDVKDKLWAAVLETIISSAKVCGFIVDMHWGVVDIHTGEHEMLTSDRPVVKTNGLAHAEGEILLPLGPTELFVAVTQGSALDRVQYAEPRALVRLLNDRIVRQAQDFVFSTSDRQLAFIEKRLGDSSPKTKE